MDAVLVVGHGSRDPEGNVEVRQFVAAMQSELGVPIVETCFLEFERPTVRDGLEACAAKGATRVMVIPLMLFSAGHSKIHIPVEIDSIRGKYPQVEFIYGRPIGIHNQVLEILTSRLAELGLNPKEEQQDTVVLVVGRGSSDPDANSDLFKMSRLFWERLNVNTVETAFMGVTDPLVEKGIERCIKLGARKIVVMPYFLFTGILIKRMDTMLQEFQENYPEVEFRMTEYFGFHPLLAHVIKDRVKEALADEVKMNCDTCQYRLEAMHHLDHHHNHDHDHHHHTVGAEK
jgi:sirohydrochlorin cobaltochelatase